MFTSLTAILFVISVLTVGHVITAIGCRQTLATLAPELVARTRDGDVTVEFCCLVLALQTVNDTVAFLTTQSSTTSEVSYSDMVMYEPLR